MSPFSRRVRAIYRLAFSLQNELRFALRGEAELKISASVNLSRDPEDPKHFCGISPDPQMHLGGIPRMALTGPVLIDVSLAPLNGCRLERPALYLRRGPNFDAANELALRSVEQNRWTAFVEEAAGLTGLRLDPSEGPCDVRLDSIRIRRLTAEAAQIAKLEPAPETRRHALDAIEARVALKNARLIGAYGVAPAPDGEALTLEGADPQLILAINLQNGDSAAEGGAHAVRLSFFVDLSARSLSAPRLYIDYGGNGFSQDRSFALAEQPDGFTALIARPELVKQIRWDPSSRPGLLRLSRIEAQPVWWEADDPAFDKPANAELAFNLSLDLNVRHFNASVALGYDYGRWLKRYATPGQADLDRMKLEIEGFGYRPSFSFVMPVYNTPPALLEACIRAMQAQIYPNFEICIADDFSSVEGVRETIERMAQLDGRIRWTARAENGHISKASNSALALATGDYVVLMDHDDLAPDYALFAVAATLQNNKNAKILYSDEDKIDQGGERCEPYFKGGFDNFLIFGQNLISHMGVYDRALVESVGGFRAGYEGSQDYDLFLRCSERCSPDEIVHIPHVLYHWRMIPGSTALAADQKGYAISAAQRSLDDAFQRRGLPFKSVTGPAPSLMAIEMAPVDRCSKVSIVIPTRDRVDLLMSCVASLDPLDSDTEILIIDNGSSEPATLEFLSRICDHSAIRVVDAPGAFNFSRLCNIGAESANGDIICLLNNDTELLSRNWLTRARCLLELSSVGAVGAKLLYPDRTLQHFGLVLGMGAHAVAGTPLRGIAEEDVGYFGKAALLQEFSAVSAACLFVRKADYWAAGGFDTKLAIAYNDVDFCLKLRALGLKIVADPEILLIHKESASRGSDKDDARAARLASEAELLRQRWPAALIADPFYSPNLTLARDDFSFAEPPRAPPLWSDSTETM